MVWCQKMERFSWTSCVLVWITAVKFNFVHSACHHGDFLPDAFDCRTYHRCDHGRIHQFTCPEGLLWNQDILTCDWPNKVKCEGTTVYTSQVRTEARGRSGKRTSSAAYTDGRQQQYSIFCYYKPPSMQRDDETNLKVENIDTSLCTHIIFDAATIDGKTGEIKFPNDWIYNAGDQVRYLKSQKPQLKILLRVGTWENGQQGYAKVSSNSRCRKKAVEKTKQMLTTTGFDGLDLNWMYPVCPQGNCEPDKTHENDQYAAMMHDLHESFGKNNPRLILTASLPSCQKIIKISYNRHAMIEDLDYVIVMAHNNHEHWQVTQTEEQSGLQYSRPNDRNLCLDSNCTMHWLAQMGLPREKLLGSITPAGARYTIPVQRGNGNHGGHSPLSGANSDPVDISYSQVCKIIQDPSWNVVDEQGSLTGPHAFKDDEWITYNTPHTIAKEVDSVKQGQFGGVAIQTIDMDDHRGSCKGKTFPLLRSIQCSLKRQNRSG